MTALGAISAGDVAVHGTVLGLVYGMLAVGLVLVYRASRVVNFAHGETGALGAALLAKLVLDDGWSWFAALPVVLSVGALVGGLTQHLIGRRLAARPRVALLTATIGLSQVLVVLQLLLPRIHHLAPYPTPVHRHLRLFGATVAGGDFSAVAVALSMAVGLWLWLGRTPTGLALAAASDNVDAARLAGVRVDRVALAAWAIAGAMATATAVVAGPVQGVIVGRETEGLGVGLLVRALAPALVARMRSVPLALGGGVVVGILQVASDTSGRDPALADVAVLILVVVALLLRAEDSRGHGARETELLPVPGPAARWPGPWIVALAAAAALPVVAGRSSQLFFCSGVVLFAVVGLSVVLLTGWTGQLSLGQVAFVGIGTLTAAQLQRVGVPFWLTIPGAAAAAAAVSLLVGLPALRVRQIELAVVTLALAVACRSWLFTRPALLATGGTLTVHRGRLGGLDTTTSVAYFETCVVALALAVALLFGVRRSGFGRMLLAVRSNERRAAALGVRPVLVKLAAFALAGAMAGAAGALLGGLRVHSGAADFGAEESLRVLAIAVIGGAGSVAGVVAGALVVLGIPALFGGTAVATLLTSGVGLLVLVLFAPGGLASVVTYLVGAVPRPSAEDDAAAAPGGAVGRLPPLSGDDRTGSVTGGVSLDVREITVAYGGNRVLDAVSLRVAPGEVIALVGPNGAGKSTLLDVISGYRRAGSGCVVVGDVDLGGASPSGRARVGMGRVFQEARLFDDLTVGEVVELAAGCAGRHDWDAARSALALLGLTPLRGRACQHLSTGTRRMVEMACVVAARPRLLLLDEPTAGLGQRESEAFAPLLVDVQRHLGATLVLVEHDLDLVVAVAPRIVCLSAGRVIADGPGAGVLHEPAVVAAYTGVAAGLPPSAPGPD